jgi:polygalacturonase
MNNGKNQIVTLSETQSTTIRTKAIQDAIDAASPIAGTVFLTGHGQFEINGLIMKKNVTLDIEETVELVGSGDERTYHRRPGPFELLRNETPISALIYGDRCDHFRLCGKGSISGNYRHFIQPGQETAEHIASYEYPRPMTIYLQNCQDVSLKDLTIVDAPFWTIHLVGCQNVAITGLTINNEVRMPNTDGIDLDRCQNVLIHDCRINTGDDGICLKCTEETKHFGDCTNIEVTDTVIHSQSSAFKVGSSSFGNFSNVTVCNLTILDANRGLAWQLRDGGSAQNFHFRDVTITTRNFSPAWWGNAEPIYLTFLARDETTKFSPTDGIENIVFERVRATGPSGIVLYTLENQKIRHVTFIDTVVTITTPVGTPHRYDLRPSSLATTITRPLGTIMGQGDEPDIRGLTTHFLDA